MGNSREGGFDFAQPDIGFAQLGFDFAQPDIEIVNQNSKASSVHHL